MPFEYDDGDDTMTHRHRTKEDAAKAYLRLFGDDGWRILNNEDGHFPKLPRGSGKFSVNEKILAANNDGTILTLPITHPATIKNIQKYSLEELRRIVSRAQRRDLNGKTGLRSMDSPYDLPSQNLIMHLMEIVGPQILDDAPKKKK